jgi:small-conductance mechanosensitive channel
MGAVRSVGVTVIGVVAAAALVVLWGLQNNVERAFLELAIGADATALSVISLVVLGVAYTITQFTKGLIRRGERRDAITTQQREIAHHVAQVLVFVPAGLFVLALWGARPGDLLLGAGAAGVVVGLAARQTLGAVLAGFVLLFARPFEIGDWVLIGDREGTVTDVDVFNTEIRTFDNEHVLVPNDRVTSDEIVNRSRTDRLRIRVDVGVDYDTEVGRAVEVAERAMRGCETVLDQPEPSVVMDEFGASAVVLTCRFWIAKPSIGHKWEAQNAVVDAVKAAFDREGIGIPFPQRVVSRAPGAVDPAQVAVERSTDGGEG